MKIKHIFAVLIFTCICIQTYAYSLTLLVMQNDNTQKQLRLSTRLIEDSLINGFFDLGVIVSNEPIITNVADSAQFTKELSSALKGGFEYILSLTVDYTEKPAVNTERVVLSDISKLQWEIYRSTDAKTIAKGVFTQENKSAAKTEKDAVRILRTFCAQMCEHINYEISKKRG